MVSDIQFKEAYGTKTDIIPLAVQGANAARGMLINPKVIAVLGTILGIQRK